VLRVTDISDMLITPVQTPASRDELAPQSGSRWGLMLSKRGLPCRRSALIGHRLPTPDSINVTRFSQSRFSTIDGHIQSTLTIAMIFLDVSYREFAPYRYT
jgi:hypothetical protein